MMDKANSGVFENCNNHIREKLQKLFDEAARICNNKRCNRCSYLDVPSCVDELDIDHLLANGVTIQQWIPVTERLPQECEYKGKRDGSEYLVWLLIAYQTDTTEYAIGYFDGYKWLS